MHLGFISSGTTGLGKVVGVFGDYAFTAPELQPSQKRGPQSAHSFFSLAEVHALHLPAVDPATTLERPDPGYSAPLR